MKKILIPLILILLGGGYYFFFYNDVPEESLEEEMLGYRSGFSREKDFYFSGLGIAEVPGVDFGTAFDVSTPRIGFDDIGIPDDFGVPEVSIQEPTFDITSPQITPSMPQAPTAPPSEEEPLDTWKPNASDCARFDMAPSCAHVDPEYQDMCEACEAAGF